MGKSCSDILSVFKLCNIHDVNYTFSLFAMYIRNRIDQFLWLIIPIVDGCLQYENVPFAHAMIGHRQSQWSVSRVFPLFTRCEWLMINHNVAKRTPLCAYFYFNWNVWRGSESLFCSYGKAI